MRRLRFGSRYYLGATLWVRPEPGRPLFGVLSSEFPKSPFGVGDCLLPFVGTAASKLGEQFILGDLNIGSARPVRQEA